MIATISSLTSDGPRVLGRVVLERGAARIDPALRPLLDDITVRDRRGVVTPEDGERYIAALPGVLRGQAALATLETD